MKNKVFSISLLSITTLALVAGFLGFVVATTNIDSSKISKIETIKTAQAEALCSGIDITVDAYDQTAGQSLGTFENYGEDLIPTSGSISVPYGHTVVYSFTAQGTPSFTSGILYTSGSFTHSQNTWSPNPTPGMPSTYTAPAITENGTFFAQVVENICEATKDNLGDESARVDLTINVTGGPPATNFDLSCTINKTVQYTSNPSATTAYDVSAYNLSPGYNNTITASPSSVTASPSSTTLTPSGYFNYLNVVYGGMAPGTYYFTISGTDGTQTKSCSQSSLTIQALQPVVQILFNNTAFQYNSTNETSGTLSWATQNATTCSASTTGGPDVSPAWNSSYNVSPVSGGSLFVANIQLDTQYTFFLNCSGPGGSSSDYVQVYSASVASPPPTVDITCKQGSFFQNGPCTVYSSGTTKLKWTSGNVTTDSCYLYKDGSPIAQFDSYGGSGYSTGNLYNPPAGTYTYTVTCAGPGAPYTVSDSVVINVIAYPTADLQCDSLDSCAITSGSSSTLSWTSSYADSCTIDNSINTNNATSGSASTGVLTNPSTPSITYTLTCVGPGGTATDTAQVNVGAYPAPSVDIKCKISAGDTATNGPCSVDYNSPAILSWTTTNITANSCSMEAGGVRVGAVSDSTNNYPTGNLIFNTTYVITCSGPGSPYTTSDSVVVNVLPAPLSVDIKCTDSAGGPKDGPCTINYNSQANLSWSYTNCTYIYIDQVNETLYYTPGTTVSDPLTANTRFTVTCYGPNGSTATDYVDVAVNPDWDVICTPATVTVVQGSSGAYGLETLAYGGWNSRVSFNNPVISPSPAVAPSFSFTNNNTYPPDRFSSVFSTTGATPGTYTLTYVGTGGSVTKSCAVTLIITAPPLSVDIDCTDSAGGPKDGPCSVAYSSAATLSWTSSNCTSVSIDQGINGVSASGSTTTGALTSTKIYTITCNGTGGPIYDTVTITVGSDFTFTCTQSSVTVVQGSSGSYNLNTTGFGGFSAPVAFSGPTYSPTTPSVAPTFSFSNNNAYPAATTVASFTTTTSTTPGTYIVTFTGVGGGITKTCSAQLIIQALPAPSVTLSVNPTSILAGQSATLSWTPTNTFTGSYCNATNSWSGTKTSTPGSIYTESTGVINTPGTYTYSIQCQGAAGWSNVASATLTVGAAPSWSLACSQPSVTVTQGSSGSYNLSTTAINGFASAVTFSGPSYNVTPATAPSWNFSNNPQTPSATTVAVFGTTTSTTPGTYTLTFTGTGGSITNTCSVQLIVLAAAVPSVTISVSPSTINVGQSSTISWTPTNTLSGSNCTATGNWGGAKTSTPGSTYTESTGTMNVAGTYTYSIQCQGTSSSSSVVSATLTVNANTLAADLKCQVDSKPPFTDGPCSINYNSTANLSWTTSNCTSVTLAGPTTTTVASSGTSTTPALTTSQTYTLTCNGVGGPVIDTVLISVGADWTLACSQPTVTVTQGTSGSYNLSTTGLGGFASPVTFSGPTYNVTPSTPPSWNFSNNSQVPNATTVAVFTTTTSTTPGTYTLTFTGDGITGGRFGTTITRTCSVELIISPAAGTAPNPPIVTTNNSTCDQISISWTPGATPPSATSFVVYYSSPASTGTWTDISGSLSSSTTTFIHNGSNPYRVPASSNNHYKVRAYNGAAYTDSRVAGPVGLTPCAINPSGSDKDLKQVAGLINKTFNPTACSGSSEVATLPNNALFSPGDVITFQINVCNSGSAPLTSVTIADTLSNLSSPVYLSSNPVGCVTGNTPGTNSIGFTLADIAASSGSTQVCSVLFTAVVTTPASGTGSIYRFQNTAKIYATEITADPTNYPLGYKEVTTPPYLFGITSNIPNRGETSP